MILAKLLSENYRSTEKAAKELIDNAWDADASKVEIDLPDPVSNKPIIIKDNGSGMTEEELRKMSTYTSQGIDALAEVS